MKRTLPALHRHCGKKKPECESVEKGGTGCFGEAYFPDGRPRLLRYTSGRNLPLLFKETCSSFFLFFSLPPQVSTSLDIYQTNILIPHISHPLFLFVRPLFLLETNQDTRIQRRRRISRYKHLFACRFRSWIRGRV